VPANDSLDSGASSSEESIAQNNQNGRLDKSRRQKLPSGWLTKEEKKALRAQCGLDDPGNSNTITYNDGGWGDQHRFDWNAPNQLVDWEGNMLPAPVEWGGRRQYRPDNLVEFIVKYIHDSQPFYVEKNGVFSSNQVIDVSHDSFRGEENSEIAPKSWITEKIENQTLQSFWESLPHIVPEPVDSDDVQGKPFWLRYQHSSAFLQPLEHLTALCEPVSDQGPSAGRNALRLWIRSKRQTADTATQEYRDKENNNAKEERRQRRIEKRIRRDQLNAPKIAPPPNPHRPKVNIYLRPINISTDVKGVLDIYKHYANETAYVSELDAPDLRAMTQRFHDIEGTALPVIVAIGRLGEGKKDHQANGYASSEKIVGFAYADEDEGRHTQMSYTADVEIYVHKDYQTKGIGQNLLDRMMYLLDPLHSCVSDVLWRPPEDEPHWTCPGGKRIVGTVRVVFYYGTDERARCMWIREWLKRFGFKMEADMSRAGVKLGKW
jgi:L-amino acid N-acyltransferase YncA